MNNITCLDCANIARAGKLRCRPCEKENRREEHRRKNENLNLHLEGQALSRHLSRSDYHDDAIAAAHAARSDAYAAVDAANAALAAAIAPGDECDGESAAAAVAARDAANAALFTALQRVDDCYAAARFDAAVCEAMMVSAGLSDDDGY